MLVISFISGEKLSTKKKKTKKGMPKDLWNLKNKEASKHLQTNGHRFISAICPVDNARLHLKEKSFSLCKYLEIKPVAKIYR